jgi:hypothetical protein
MAQYGEIVNEYEPEIDSVYSLFNKYFDNPLLVKTKDINNLSMYIVKVYCLLSTQCRYIIALVPLDTKNVGDKQYLDSLRWVSLQTRTLDQMNDVPSHSYLVKKGGELNSEIVRIKKDQRCSTYKCDKLPISITLLHKDKSIYEYQDKGIVISALETYQTIITLNNNLKS